MSTLEMRAAHLPKAESRFGGFARFVSIVHNVFEVLEEAQRQAREAERRYPFISE
jgi:hypothetical protein